MTWLIVQDFSLLVEAFFMRKPDDDPAAVHAWLLGRNAHMYGLSYSIDQVGDIYIVGRLPLSAVEPEEIDRLLGCMLRYSDDAFDTAVALGFADAIQQMWAAFVDELVHGDAMRGPFRCATPQEAAATHRVFTAALESHAQGSVVAP